MKAFCFVKDVEEAKEDGNIRYLIGKVILIYEMRIMAISVVAVGKKDYGYGPAGKVGYKKMGLGCFQRF